MPLAEVETGAGPGLSELLDAAVDGIGGQPREGQREMARAVSQAFTQRRHLVVQAGTGTGKSLAYLVPAALHAGNGQGPVVVSTATLALQAQLVRRDLPRLADSLAAVSSRPSFAVLKGRSHYLCRNRLAGSTLAGAQGDLFGGSADAWTDPDGRPPGGGRVEAEMRRIREWAKDTQTGDREDLSSGVSDLAWRQVSVSARQCMGATRCPFGDECFAERARETARDSDIVVTNHTMLALDALTDVRVLPEHELTVVDEAHELVDRATAAATDVLEPQVLDRLLRRVARTVGEDEGAALGGGVQEVAGLLASLPLGRVHEWNHDAAQVLSGLRDGASSALAGSAAREGEGQEAALGEIRAELGRTRDAVARLLSLASADVAWVAADRSGGRTLRVAPLSVSGLLGSAVFGERTVVATSATLAVGGSLTPAARSFGLHDESDWRGLDVGSPFDYRKQAILYCPRHLPTPGRQGPSEAVLAEIAALVAAAGGRTLGLFSSMAAARAATDHCRDQLPYPILLQGDTTTGELVRQFAGDEPTCLFGTLSLWQGVDVPGPACSLVVIDRLPFPRPDDPLASARREAADARGANGFREVYLSTAALLLAQGTGRLIRSPADRGVVAVLDPRLATAQYGRLLLDSIAPFWSTSDPEVVRASLRRLRDA